MKLLLFDVDLTLINSSGAGRRAMTLAFEKVFEKKNGLKNVNLAGRTDPQILKDALNRKGLEWQPESEERFKHAYFELLKNEIEKPNYRTQIMPGISKILSILSSYSDMILGLLTGNWRQGAMIKLGHFNLTHFFQLGAFADDSDIREELPQFAAQRLEETFGIPIPPKDVFIIGDTPLDVACSKPFGAKSIAVATGFFSYEELEAANPDYTFENLSDYEKLLRILNEEI